MYSFVNGNSLCIVYIFITKPNFDDKVLPHIAICPVCCILTITDFCYHISIRLPTTVELIVIQIGEMNMLQLMIEKLK